MKSTRIYGIKKGKRFCHFPRGKNKMEHIKVQVYNKKAILVYYGTAFKCSERGQWEFMIGDVRCCIYEYKKLKFKVNDQTNEIFNDNQVAGVFFLMDATPLTFNQKERFDVRVDDEHARIRDIGAPPYRSFDSRIASIMGSPTLLSDRTGQCTRNREYMSIVLSEKMYQYEIVARNNIIESHCNSWKNRFAQKYVEIYVLSDHFSNHLFKAIDQYFFSNTLCLLAEWVFYTGAEPILAEPPGRTIVYVKVQQKVLQSHNMDMKSVIASYQNGLTAILYSLLSSSKTDMNCHDMEQMGMNMFGGYTKTDVFLYKMKHVPTVEYQMLFNGDKPGLFLMS